LSAPNINITDPDFKQPSIWKANLALDHKLPFLDTTLTIEGYYTKNDKMPNTVFLNYLLSTPANGATTMPDGRLHYNGTITNPTTTSVNGRRRVSTGGPVGSGFADVLYLTNTDKGYSNGATIGLKRNMKNKWAWGFDWTRAHATEVSPITSSTASSNYSNRAVFNPNEDEASTSNTNIRDRFVLTLARAPEGLSQTGLTAAVEVPALGEIVQPLVLQQARKMYIGPFVFAVRVADQAGKFQLTREVEFLGPEAKLLREDEEEKRHHGKRDDDHAPKK
jgi:hypothetical protein